MTQGGPRQARAWMWMLIPVLLFLGLHLRAIDYEFVWTDQGEIEQGLLIRPPGEILAAFGEPMYRALEDVAPGATQPYYRPLPVVTLSLIDHTLGRQPRHFRALLLALGTATLVIFFYAILPLTRDPRTAAVAASIVAAHPAGIEDYVWIAGLSAAFATFFTCASLAAVPRLMRAEKTRERALLILLAMLGLVGGLLSKEGAALIPALTLALIVSLAARSHRERPGEISRGRLVERFKAQLASQLTRSGPALLLLGLQIAVVAAYLLVARPLLLGGTMSGAPPIRGNWHVHLPTVLATWPDRLAWLFMPLHSTTSDVVMLAGPASPAAWLGVLLLLAAPVVWVLLLRNGRFVAAFGWAWIWIAFLPTSGLVPLTHVVAVRYMSLSVFGVALLWPEVFERLHAARNGRWIAGAASIVLVLALSERTWARVPDWQSDITLFGRAVARDPLYREGHYVLAVALAEQRKFAEARERLDQLRIANGRFGSRYSFSRDQDIALLLCKLNLELDDPEDTLHVLQRELRPDSSLMTSAPELMRCAARSLQRVGRTTEARAISGALDTRRARPR